MFWILLNIVFIGLMLIAVGMISLIAAIPLSRPGGLQRVFKTGLIAGIQILILILAGFAAVMWHSPAFLFSESDWTVYSKFSLIHITMAGALGAMFAFIVMAVAGAVVLITWACVSEQVKDARTAVYKIRAGLISATPKAVAREIVSEYFIISMLSITFLSAITGAFLLKTGTETWQQFSGAGLIIISVSALALLFTMLHLGARPKPKGEAFKRMNPSRNGTTPN